MTAPELIRDLERPSGWWLLVDGSEQSYIDIDDPRHLEFEYVQLLADVLDVMMPDDEPLTALHLGGGLLTVPRWLAVTHPGSRQVVAERSPVIARMAASLGEVDGTQVKVADAHEVATASPLGVADVIVCDVYDGPETVTSMFTLSALAMLRSRLSPRGIYLCNLSDATPFRLSRTVVATVCAVFGSVLLLAEPPVLRGRRSGNIVLLGTDRLLPVKALTRRAASGAIRARVLSGQSLTEFIGDALPAGEESDLPPSADSAGRALWP